MIFANIRFNLGSMIANKSGKEGAFLVQKLQFNNFQIFFEIPGNLR